MDIFKRIFYFALGFCIATYYHDPFIKICLALWDKIITFIQGAIS